MQPQKFLVVRQERGVIYFGWVALEIAGCALNDGEHRPAASGLDVTATKIRGRSEKLMRRLIRD